VKPTEPRGNGGEMMRASGQNKAPTPQYFFLDVVNLCLTLNHYSMKNQFHFESSLNQSRHLVIHSTTQRVDKMNNHVFTCFAKEWACSNSFFPSLSLIGKDSITLKIFYHSYLGDECRQIAENCLYYYSAGYGGDYPRFSSARIIFIPLAIYPSNEEISTCQSIKELEKLCVSKINIDNYIGIEVVHSDSVNWSSYPTLKKYRYLIVHPSTKEVDEINDHSFHQYVRKWAYYHSFLPVLSKIQKDRIIIKLFYYENLRCDLRQIDEFCATFYREVFPNLIYSKANFIHVPLKNKIEVNSILKCNSMKELESLYIDSLSDHNYVSGGTTYGVSHISRNFNRWSKLLDEGYLKPEYEEKCRAESTTEEVYIKKKNDSSAGNRAEEKSINLQFFMKTGGSQPESWDANAIDKFFKGNLAKRWAMCDGYLPTFKSYVDGVINFDLVTDPRCTGLYWISLCNHIANQYKEHVKLLKDATHFKAEHFIANDIIGFNINANDTDKFNKYNDRVQATYASLPLKPEATHYGKIR